MTKNRKCDQLPNRWKLKPPQTFPTQPFPSQSFYISSTTLFLYNPPQPSLSTVLHNPPQPSPSIRNPPPHANRVRARGDGRTRSFVGGHSPIRRGRLAHASHHATSSVHIGELVVRLLHSGDGGRPNIDTRFVQFCSRSGPVVSKMTPISFQMAPEITFDWFHLRPNACLSTEK